MPFGTRGEAGRRDVLRPDPTTDADARAPKPQRAWTEAPAELPEPRTHAQQMRSLQIEALAQFAPLLAAASTLSAIVMSIILSAGSPCRS